MIVRIFLLLTIAVGLVGFGTITWISIHSSDDQPTAESQDRVSVLTAAGPLRAGTLLKPEDITASELRRTAVPEGASIDGPTTRRALVGAMLRRSLGVGEVLLPGDTLRPGDHGFLAAVLAPGHRAVTVGVDMVSGTAGLIWPGDHVDVILTQSIDDARMPISRRVAAETVLQGARVIAIDQQIVSGPAPDPQADKAGGAAGGSRPGIPFSETSNPRTVTLDVVPGDAERVQVAARLGRLSLAVRASVENGDHTPEGRAIFAGDVSHALSAEIPAAPPPNVVRIYQGSADGKEFRF
jgi:pilus assembly protein CpaB